MSALRAYIKPSIFQNIFSKIEKIVNIFSIFKKFFSKINGLMYVLIHNKILETPIVHRILHFVDLCDYE